MKTIKITSRTGYQSHVQNFQELFPAAGPSYCNTMCKTRTGPSLEARQLRPDSTNTVSANGNVSTFPLSPPTRLSPVTASKFLAFSDLVTSRTVATSWWLADKLRSEIVAPNRQSAGNEPDQRCYCEGS